ncbi:hypothetical protein [Corynebacterium anserum]|uniref:Uncharacterized protein n=1 Tax=Corynebacterium anserum TaxID=2684406 RepID=A0A7G7YMT3_9CORY|nr:hypothetical protein [Corynebacterium anserum]MBC2681181.1 hypothetical protein [Corynebacterium anserum]QNH95803.1 hypothetical protein GP473_03155 [Corynebacterium anserum]
MTSLATPSGLSHENYAREVDALLNHLTGLNIIKPSQPRRGWTHAGTVLVDAVMQERSTFDPLLRPKAEKAVAQNPAAGDFLGVMDVVNDPQFQHSLPLGSRARFESVMAMAAVMREQGCETVADVRRVFDNDDEQLRSALMLIARVDTKTVDMLSVLVGANSGVVVDGRVRRVLSDAGIDPSDYQMSKAIVLVAAQELNWTPAQMDATLWNAGNRTWIPRYG